MSLPLVDSSGPSPSWYGWTPTSAVAPPEPFMPQGAYGEETTPAAVVTVGFNPKAASARSVELLAPAGGLEAAYAALHFGADAIYLGLKKFSARAEAENFSLEEVREITAYAHGLEPRRRVFVAINTVIRQDELAEVIQALADLSAIGVDAIIVQDLGVYRALVGYFPSLERHASTQMAIHNRAGAEMLRRVGFARVVLARELTLEEIADISAVSGVETEVFVHGALCYSYSGLCLFSSQTLGRSGNRGKCAYSCRDSYEVADAPLELRDGSPVKRDPRRGFPFSMKDLALPNELPALRDAGVACFKIEGRKKSPLYVATTTDYYRRLLDGRLPEAERPRVEADLQTVFSRPWTRLFIASHRDKEVADRDTVGHRGAPIGRVEAVRQGHLRFRTARALERHDGLQVDLPALGKPFGFAVERLWVVGKNGRQASFTAPAGAVIEVALPAEHPDLPRGALVYCSASQAVKQKYRYYRPKPGAWRLRTPIAIDACLSADKLEATARATAADGSTVVVQHCLAGPFGKARDPTGVAAAARDAFARLGDTELALADWTWNNPDGRFVPVSRLNSFRRELTKELRIALTRRQTAWVRQIQRETCPAKLPGPVIAQPTTGGPAGAAWSLKVDRLGFLDGLVEEDWRDVEEVVIDIARDGLLELQQRLAALGDQLGRERLRLALPPLTRAWEDKALRHKIAELRRDGWLRWEAANLSAWTYLDIDPHRPEESGLDLATDWPIYVLNRLAARQLLEWGATRFCLSPEDGLANMRSLLAEFSDRAVVIVHQDTPLFIAESCAYANLIGGCPGKANCRFESMEMQSSQGEKVTAFDYHCRTIVLNRGAYCLANRLDDLLACGARRFRADFVYRRYDPSEVRRRWRLVRAGRNVPGGHAANFDRGLQ
ncbi:MAG: U32 family peptidase [Gemmataceae bacterium]|nr:U32 family peptidase [Gemmataceae bacterium]